MNLPRPTSRENVYEALAQLVDALERRLPANVYVTATRPAAASVPVGTIINVTDGGAGAVFQASDGTNWINLG